jgi:DNA-binding transcriptional LysR family regulator
MEASPYRLWLPIGHALAEAGSIGIGDLADEPFVLLMLDEIAEAAEYAWRRAGVRPPVAIRTRSVEAARSLVATGAGVAILPELTYRPWSLEGDKIEARDLVEALPPVEVVIGWRRGSPLDPIAEQFVAVARAYRAGRR